MRFAIARQFFGLGLVLIVANGCAARAPADKALILASRGSKIVFLDGEEMSKRRVAVSAGHHTVRFQTSTKLLLFSPVCGVRLNLREGVPYRFSTRLNESHLPTDALGRRWRMLEGTGVLSVHVPEQVARELTLPCEDCITFKKSGTREEAVNCNRYRAISRIEQLCELRNEANVKQCVRDGMTLVLAWLPKRNDLRLFIPGLEAEYSSEEHLDAFHTCIKGATSEVEACLAARGWEFVP